MLAALLHNLAAAGDAWDEAIMDDLTMMRAGLRQMAQMPWPRHDPAAWLRMARDWPQEFKTLAKSYRKRQLQLTWR